MDIVTPKLRYKFVKSKSKSEKSVPFSILLEVAMFESAAYPSLGKASTCDGETQVAYDHPGPGGVLDFKLRPPSTHKKVVLSPVFVYVYHLLGSFIFEG